MNPRFHTLESEADATDHDSGAIYFREPCGDSERLVVGASKKQIALLDKLSASFPSEQIYALYVLLVSRIGHSYNPENDKYEDEIIGHFDWVRTDLKDGDEWL